MALPAREEGGLLEKSSDEIEGVEAQTHATWRRHVVTIFAKPGMHFLLSRLSSIFFLGSTVNNHNE